MVNLTRDCELRIANCALKKGLLSQSFFALFLKAVDYSLEAALLAVAEVKNTVNTFLRKKTAGKAAEGTKGHILD